MTLVTPVIQPAGPSAPYSLSEPIHRERAPTATNAMLLRALFGLEKASCTATGDCVGGAAARIWLPGATPTWPLMQTKLGGTTPAVNCHGRLLRDPGGTVGRFDYR